GQVARDRDDARFAHIGIPALDVGLLAAALRDDLAVRQEYVGHFDRLAEQPAAILAQIDDVAERLVPELLVDLLDRLDRVGPGLGREGVDVDDADAVLDVPLHRPLHDDLAL